MTLIAFDFGGTISASDLTVLLGKEYDVGTEIEGLVEQGLRGDESFTTSLQQRATLLEGMQDHQVQAAYQHATLREGIADLLGDLRRSGATVAIITGSFERGVETALEAADLTVDHLVANRLVMDDGVVTGEVEGPLLERRKDQALEQIVVDEREALGRTIAVGDGPTDLPMLQVAGTAVGLNPTAAVEQYCDVVVPSVGDLRRYFEQHGIVDIEKPGE